MSMMYKIVTNALEEAGLSDQFHPQDYLNFYCLGKREASSSKPSSQAHQPTENRALVCFFSLSNDFLTSNNKVMFTCSINKFSTPSFSTVFGSKFNDEEQ